MVRRLVIDEKDGETVGMYNEVYCTCPKCGKRGYMQIEQIVLGLGGFDLNDENTLTELDEEKLIKLSNAVNQDKFECRVDPVSATENVLTGKSDEGCGWFFNPVTGFGYENQSNNMMKQLFPYL